MVRLILGNILSRLETDDTKLLQVLAKKYRKPPPGYKYTPAYKYRNDKGEVDFFGTDGSFGTGLRHHIYKDLDFLDIPFTIEDNRSSYLLDREDLPGVQLRDYQEALVEVALEKGGCVVEAPTGAGKTFIMASILSALKEKTGVIFFTRKQLLLQTYEVLKGLGFDVGVCFGEGVDIKPITLCTVQSVDKILDTHLKQSDFILIDEVHEFSKGKVTSAVIKSFPNASVRIGFSATIPKDHYQLLTLTSFLGPVVKEVDVSTLVDAGFLSQADITMFDFGEEPDPQDRKSMGYLDVYDKYIIKNKARNDLIKTLAIKARENKGKVLILVQSLAHAKILQKSIEGSLLLQGNDSLTVRRDTIKKFIKPGGTILIGTVIMQTGIDIPEISHFINARGLKSDISTIQAMGRSLRTHKSKSKVYIYDFMDNRYILHGHGKRRFSSYKKLGFKVNRVCYQKKTEK